VDTSSDQALRPGSILLLYRDIWRQLVGQRSGFVSAVVLLICAQAVLLAVPFFSGKALNALQLHGVGGFREASAWLCMVLVTACVSWLFHGPARILERRSAILIRQRLSASLVERLFQLPLSWHSRHHSGATAHRVQQSTQALAGFAQSQFIYLNSAVRLLGPLATLCWVDAVVGTAAAGGFCIILCSVVGFDRAMLRLAAQEIAAERRYSATLVDTLGNATTVYALRQARAIAARLQQRLANVFIPLRRAIVLNELKWCTVDLSTRVLTGLLVGLFVWRAARGGATAVPANTLLLGSLYMVWEYAQQAAGVIASIASHFQTFARQQADYASADMIQTSSTVAAALESRTSSAPVWSLDWQRLVIRELSFSHPDARCGAPALSRVALSLERGKRYALVGSSGSGKSSLMRVLAGLYRAGRIAITLDHGATQVCPIAVAHALRGRVTLVPQDPQLYEGTLAENLALCESITGPPAPETLAMALDAACANDFVETTASALDVPIAEGAADWSGGQRSRIALARGILAAAGSQIVLLDEPSASLDPQTEARVYSNLFATFEQACIVSSVHRLGLLDRFDEILVMHEGRLVAQGSVDDLLLGCPEFRRLTAIQGIQASKTDVATPAQACR
jgi:ATP-binding cassette, subfamily B, bacterial